jgi:hypothetical protein
MRAVLAVVGLLLVLLPAAAQDAPTARFSASKLEPLTGEPFEITLSVDVPQGITLAGWPEIPAEWGPFEVIAASEPLVDTRADGFQVYAQTFTVRAWRPGDAETPETIITYAPSPGLMLRVPVRAERVLIPTVLDFNDLTLRPLRPPLDLFYVPVEIVAALAGMLGVAVYAGARVYRRRTLRERPLPEPAPRERLESALAAADMLEPADQLALTADALHGYAAARFNAGDGLTTGELLDALAGRLPDGALVWLQQVLAHADAVKFSGEVIMPEDIAYLNATLPGWIAQVEAVESAVGQG